MFLTLKVIGNTLFAGTEKGVYRSSDDGISWSESGIKNHYIGDFAEIGTTLFASMRDFTWPNSSNPIFRSIDNGLSWSETKLQLSSPVWSLEVIGTTLFVGANAVYRSTDYGDTWSETSPMIMDEDIFSLGVIGQILFAGTSSTGMYRSTDYGNSWTEINSGLLSKYIYPIITKGSVIFVRNDNYGVFRSMNNGDYWSDANEGLTNKNIRAFAFKGETLFAGTDKGVWKVDIATLGVEQNKEQSSTIPLTCYPNPASTSLTIDRSTLSFSDASPVKYTISTLTGNKRIEVEKDESRFSLPIEELGSGVYYLQAKQGVVRSAVMFTVVR